MARLTHQQQLDRATNSTELQGLVTDLASLLGWHWVHFRAARTKHGWKVPVEGPLGAGWPDLFMVRQRDARRLFVELKREKGDEPTPKQTAIHELLRAVGLPVFVWRPSDLSEGRVEAVLR